MCVSSVSTTMLIRLCGILEPHNGILAQFEALLKFLFQSGSRANKKPSSTRLEGSFRSISYKYALLGSAGGHYPHEAADKEEQRSDSTHGVGDCGCNRGLG